MALSPNETESRKKSETGSSSQSESHAMLLETVNALGEEMEIAGYATNAKGQLRRKVPRQVSLERTKKRKILEKNDDKEQAVYAADPLQTRIRGSMAAFDDTVLKDSLIRDSSSRGLSGTIGDADEATNGDEIEDMEEEMDADDDSGSEVDEEDRIIDNGDDENDEEIEQTEKSSENKKTKNLRGKKVGGAKMARLMYRLKNFKSFRLAERHGEALGAHARGMPRTAVQRLGEVAEAAPIAPQVYSSLGLVYETMLLDNNRNRQRQRKNARVNTACDENTPDQEEDLHEYIKTRLGLAKKAHGSCHIAALLCKRDYTLWVRAGDAAMEIADCHSLSISLPDATEESINIDREEKKKWVEEALKSYKHADNTQPPGISVPAKLAHAHMEVGRFSEALTILTDLKNRVEAPESSTTHGNSLNTPSKRRRSEMDRSYAVWMLYADLMLRIGHECNQWNRGVQENKNYMFKRWLRLYSKTFDWRERRLQALCLALEAAVGSKASTQLTKWVKDRAEQLNSCKKGRSNILSWQMDAYETETTNAIVGEDDNGKISSDKTSGTETHNDEGLHSIDKSEHQLSQEDASVDGDKELSDTPLNDVGDGDDGDGDIDSAFQVPITTQIGDPLALLESEFSEQRQNLISLNQLELAEFDKETKSMALPIDSLSSKKRDDERKELTRKQKDKVLQLVGNHLERIKEAKERNSDLENEEERQTSIADSDAVDLPALPMGASCATVCEISSQLTKHCLGLGQYYGGRLVTEAVSIYLRERGNRHELRRIGAENSLGRGPLDDEAILQVGTKPYDEINHEFEDSDDEGSNLLVLSDDEDFDETDNMIGETLDSMKRGCLPPELQVLYALCLIGEGGKNFIAWNSLHQAIREVPNENMSFALNVRIVDENIIPDSSWILFHRAMTSPLQQASSLVFISDMLVKMGKEKEWSGRLAPMYDSYLETIQKSGWLKTASEWHHSHSLVSLLHMKQCRRIMLAFLRMELYNVEVSIQSLPVADDEKDVSIELQNSLVSATRVIDYAMDWQEILWTPVVMDGALTPASVEFVKICSKFFSIIMEIASRLKKLEDESFVLKLYDKAKCITMTLLGIDISVEPNVSESIMKWKELPFETKWQSSELRLLSSCAFNLCVGCSVSLFSGWERDKFTLELLKKRAGPDFIGVNLDGTQISGYLDSNAEKELSRQWKDIQEFVPCAGTLDFDVALLETKESTWYKQAIHRHTTSCQKVSAYGEECGILFLLGVSRMFITLARIKQDEEERASLIKRAISIIFPMAQFCLDRKLWVSSLGVLDMTEHGRKERRNFLQMQSRFEGMGQTEGRLSPQPQELSNRQSRRKALRKKQKASLKAKNNNRIRNNQSRSPFSKLVCVPMDVLLQEWNTDPLSDEQCSASSNGPKCSEKMTQVNDALKQMRLSHTLSATQKTSIKAAVALVDLAGEKDCYNPFVCLHQAAMFAGQGAKRGKNDLPFKKALPPEAECSPLEALTILGRADCMRALHFIEEAMFLCTYVTKLTKLHRSPEHAFFPWTAKWRVVAIHMYTVYVAIDDARESIDKGVTKPNETEELDITVQEEIRQAQSDAFSLKRNTSSGPFNNDEEEDDIDETDNESDSSDSDRDVENDDEAAPDSISNDVDGLVSLDNTENKHTSFFSQNIPIPVDAIKTPDRDAENEDVKENERTSFFTQIMPIAYDAIKTPDRDEESEDVRENEYTSFFSQNNPIPFDEFKTPDRDTESEDIDIVAV